MSSDNDALRVNPFIVNDRTVDIHITVDGSDWYWAVMSIMGTTMLAILGLSLLRPHTSRLFHYVLAVAALVAMVEHYSMGANLGWVPIDVEWKRANNPLVAGVNRQIWWVRYCGWFLIWPLLTLAVLLTAAMPAASIIWTCFLSAVMSVMALVGAMVRTEYKWGYYGFWIACWASLGYYLVWVPRLYARQLGKDIRRTCVVTAAWIWFLWMAYPVCWGISEGGNVIAPDSEFIFYGILDCVLIPPSCAFLLWSHRKIDPARLGLLMRDFDGPIAGFHNTVSTEKTHAEDIESTSGNRGMTNGTTSNGNASPKTA